MSRKYQGVIIINAQGKEESVDDMVSKIGQEIEEEGAKLEQIDQLGKREFVYNARHLSHGFYVNYHFEAEPDTIVKLRKRLSLNKTVHLQHYDRVEG